MGETPKITKCPPGEAIGYRDDDERLPLGSRQWLENWRQELDYRESVKRDAAKERNFNGVKE